MTVEYVIELHSDIEAVMLTHFEVLVQGDVLAVGAKSAQLVDAGPAGPKLTQRRIRGDGRREVAVLWGALASKNIFAGIKGSTVVTGKIIIDIDRRPRR